MMQINQSSWYLWGREFPLYTAIPIAGMVVAVVLNSILAKRRGLDPSFVFRVSLPIYFAFLLGQMMQDSVPQSLLLFFYPVAVFGIPVAFGLVGRLLGKNSAALQDLGVILVLVFAMAARLGCFFAGCCHGVPWDHFGSVVYGSNTHCPMWGTPLFPLQLVSALLIALLLLGAIGMFLKGRRLWTVAAWLLVVYYTHLWLSPYNTADAMTVVLLGASVIAVPVTVLIRKLRLQK